MTHSDPEVARLVFRCGDAFPADDAVSRFVMRLSMALGDIRVAIDYAVRDEQPDYERMYFVRLAAMHLRELVHLIDPPEPRVEPEPCPTCGKPEPRPEFTLPDLDALIAATNPPAERVSALRAARARIVDALAERLELRPVLLRQELRRLRNGFAHYHRDRASEDALTEAMERAADLQGRYVIREHTMRAEYADDVAANFVHPFPDEQAHDMAVELYGRIVGLLDPISDYLHLAEAVYLHSRPKGVVRQIDAAASAERA